MAIGFSVHRQLSVWRGIYGVWVEEFISGACFAEAQISEKTYGMGDGTEKVMRGLI